MGGIWREWLLIPKFSVGSPANPLSAKADRSRRWWTAKTNDENDGCDRCQKSQHQIFQHSGLAMGTGMYFILPKSIPASELSGSSSTNDCEWRRTYKNVHPRAGQHRRADEEVRVCMREWNRTSLDATNDCERTVTKWKYDMCHIHSTHWYMYLESGDDKLCPEGQLQLVHNMYICT